MTSSKIRSVPFVSVNSRNPSRNPGSGGTTPIFPATGSTMIAAKSSPNFSNVDFYCFQDHYKEP